ncbi:hypothetical protein BDP27DRAFT_1315502 [Rhodocollybia butyracea]|uniref:Uncharacterized protein n=1 Tax=Rhodocollybia butyracea TaxID=206335 RepID=A0A9P5PZ28_9AGAR|nr:hypothetical protein BDP27DRAFT_1315502 [Rhodocollybia butyracea]
MPGPESGVYIITSLCGQGGTVGVPNPTNPSRPPQSEPLVTVPHDFLQNKWHIFRSLQDGPYMITSVSSFYMLTGVQDDNSVIATNDRTESAEWEITGFDNQAPDLYVIHRSRGSQAWTVEAEQTPETQSPITVSTLQLDENLPPKPTQLFKFSRLD